MSFIVIVPKSSVKGGRRNSRKVAPKTAVFNQSKFQNIFIVIEYSSSLKKSNRQILIMSFQICDFLSILAIWHMT